MEWNDDLLISLVQKYPQLWNKRNMQFKNKNAKSNVWRTIDRSAKKCEKRFSKKRSEKASTASGMGSHATSQWTHYQAMEFLDAFISSRKRRNNGNVVERLEDSPQISSGITGEVAQMHQLQYEEDVPSCSAWNTVSQLIESAAEDESQSVRTAKSAVEKDASESRPEDLQRLKTLKWEPPRRACWHIEADG
ncbi:unnamed protein product [Brassicogethes aeneus]|uniref:MADF domain-containing protein n=1 Tax=Brassicogethes aeneus TaxID=1431903 RepID=A0A9P0FPU1_BRAAE|nr:unnamed protein product [Brassicogethes aeneus]